MSTTPRDASLANLCGGMLTSAWDGVCSGVATAAWQAVQGTANASLKGRVNEKTAHACVGHVSLDDTGRSIMACLAGKTPGDSSKVQVGNGQSPPNPGEGVQTSSPPNGTSNDQMLATILEMQKQQTMLQEQLLQIQKKSESTAMPQTSAPAQGSHTVENSRESSITRGPRSKVAAAKGRAKASAKAKSKAKCRAKAKAVNVSARRKGPSARPKASNE